MPTNSRISSKDNGKRTRAMTPDELINRGLIEHPDLQLVREISIRAMLMDSKEPPRVIGVATDVVIVPTNSQCPV
jgi:hypothetical protein